MTLEEPFFILAGNGPYDNRGCEAIVRGTTKILRNYYENPSFLCISHFQNDDQFKKQCIEESDPAIIHKKTNRPQKITNPKGLCHRLLRVINSDISKKLVYKDIFPHLDRVKAVLSVGGDNYSLDYGIPQLFTDLDDVVLKNQKSLIIWGASVGPFNQNPKYEKYMIKHLKDITGIFVREPATLKYLNVNGVIDNVYRVADPAFVMDAKEPIGEKRQLNIEDESLGINFSPLMAKYVTEGNQEAWVKTAAKILYKISERTSQHIYLIPHVTSPHSNDYLFMEKILKQTSNKISSITLIPPIYNAAEIKWIISKMKLFAGARTHSTIASLSSCVPTLSFAYSIKARGINQDIFEHDQYCINPNNLQPETVLEKIESMISEYKNIRNELKSKIPAIKEKAMLSGDLLQKVLE